MAHRREVYPRGSFDMNNPNIRRNIRKPSKTRFLQLMLCSKKIKQLKKCLQLIENDLNELQFSNYM
jgi:hypothetical protein